MYRLTWALLLGAGVLLTSYISAPAAPTPASARVSLAELAEIEALVPLAQDVAQETDRLRARLSAAPVAPVARRDPFNFGSVRRPDRPVAPAAHAQLRAPAVEAAPPIAWPSLVAVLTAAGDAPVFTAVLGIGDGIEMLKKGSEANGFLVRDVTSSSVELIHVATTTVTRLSLR